MRTNVERKSDKCKPVDKMYVFIQLHSNHTQWPTRKGYWFRKWNSILEEMWKKVSGYRFMCT